MMKGVVERGTGVPAVVGIDQPVAGKTGTTNDFNDAWFLGFTPGVLTGCWIGYDQPKSLGKDQTGGNVCGPIWNEFMKVALADQPDIDFAIPDGVTLQQTGGVTEAFKTGQSPGAQTADSLLAGTSLTPAGTSPAAPSPAAPNPVAGATPDPAPGTSPAPASGQSGQPATPGQPAAPASSASVDKQLGGLY
jgi:penicillin-binding protein 1A